MRYSVKAFHEIHTNLMTTCQHDTLGSCRLNVIKSSISIRSQTVELLGLLANCFESKWQIETDLIRLKKHFSNILSGIGRIWAILVWLQISVEELISGGALQLLYYSYYSTTATIYQFLSKSAVSRQIIKTTIVNDCQRLGKHAC